MAKFTVILDACVLYPAPLRDLLIELAVTRLYRAKWTHEIQNEWIENLLKNRPDIPREKLERTKALMDRAVPDGLVVGYDNLIPLLQLPDEKDRHVLAAAIQSRADAIVTYNLKDFPPEVLRLHDLEAIHPDDFIINQFDLNLADALTAAQRCLRRLLEPPMTADQWFSILEGQSLPKTVALLRTYVGLFKPV